MKFIVTGGLGFIGSHVVEELVKLGYEVVIIDNEVTGSEQNIVDVLSYKGLTILKKDVCDIKGTEKELKGVSYIIHLAALADIVPSIENPLDYTRTNITGTLNMLEVARKLNVKRFVYSASSSCYGLSNVFPTNEQVKCDPRYPYALSKYLGEQAVLHWHKVYKLPVTSLRFFNVYGPRSRTTGSYGAVLGVFLAQKANNKPYTIVGTGYQSRDFVHVRDVANAVCLSLFHPDAVGEIFNVGSGHHYTIKTLVGYLGKGKTTHLPARPGEPTITQACITKIQTKLGWNPKIVFIDGIKELMKKVDDWKGAPVWDTKKIEAATDSWFKHLG